MSVGRILSETALMRELEIGSDLMAALRREQVIVPLYVEAESGRRYYSETAVEARLRALGIEDLRAAS